MNILHPIRTFIKAVITILIQEALEELPELKQQGINILNSRKDEFIEDVKVRVKAEVQSFIAKKVNQAKEKIVNITHNPN